MLVEEITMKDFSVGLERTNTLVLPYGTTEAHGTHLPLDTDTIIIEEVAKRASEEVPLFVAPSLHYGVCTSTGLHPGTIGITPRTLRSLTKDIVKDAFKKGIKSFVLVSGHGGSIHVAAIKEAAEGLINEIDGIRIAAFSIYEILPREAFELAETENDSHAGELETSLILYLRPELVKGRDSAQYPKLPKPVLVRDKLRYWPGAVWGDPQKASAEKGKKLFDLMVKGFLELLGRLHG